MEDKAQVVEENAEKSIVEHDNKKDKSHVKNKNWLSIAALFASFVALIFSWLNNELSVEGVRPVLSIHNFIATYDKDNVYLKYKINNTGKSTAVIDKFEIVLIQLGNGKYSKKIIDNDATNKILYIDGEYEGEIELPRYIEDSNSNMKLDIANANPSGFVFGLKYFIRGKPYFPFKEHSVLTESTWK